MKKRTKIIIIAVMVLLLGVTGYLNVMLNKSVSNNNNDTVTTSSYFQTYRTDRVEACKKKYGEYEVLFLGDELEEDSSLFSLSSKYSTASSGILPPPLLRFILFYFKLLFFLFLVITTKVVNIISIMTIIIINIVGTNPISIGVVTLSFFILILIGLSV